MNIWATTKQLDGSELIFTDEHIFREYNGLVAPLITPQETIIEIWTVRTLMGSPLYGLNLEYGEPLYTFDPYGPYYLPYRSDKVI